MIKAVIFDLDNTLYSETDYVLGVYRNIAKRIAELRPLVNFDSVVKKMVQLRKISDATVLNKIISEYEIDNNELKNLIDIYHKSNLDISMYQDATDFFHIKRELKYGLLTNGSKETQLNKIKLLELKDKFHSIVITGENFPKEEWKPHEKPFKYILKKLDIKAEECLFVGDLLDNDIIGALNVGMHAYHVERDSFNGLKKKRYKDKLYWSSNSLTHIDKIINAINMRYNPKVTVQKLNHKFNMNDIYIWRDDLLPFSFGGNKLRKSEYYFKDIINNKSGYVVTYGSGSSNHTRIVANKAKQLDIPCIVITPEENYKNTNNSLLVQELDVKVIKTPLDSVKQTIDEVISNLIKHGKSPYFIEGGGHGLLGTQAYVDVFESIIEYEFLNNINFDFIFLASGTGSTQAGLICGSIQSGIDKNIVGISIARKNPRGKNIVESSVNQYLKHMDITSDKGKEIIFLDDYIMGGYGNYNLGIKKVIKEMFYKEGIPLDSTYTGKAYFGMKDYIMLNEIQNKNILFIHTGGTPLFFDNIKEFTND